jgi:hypothetical protein
MEYLEGFPDLSNPYFSAIAFLTGRPMGCASPIGRPISERRIDDEADGLHALSCAMSAGAQCDLIGRHAIIDRLQLT